MFRCKSQIISLLLSNQAGRQERVAVVECPFVEQILEATLWNFRRPLSLQSRYLRFEFWNTRVLS
jgi:hypothetical protein